MSDRLASQLVHTRKAHECWGCGRSFPPGTAMGREVEADGGHIITSYWCAVCAAYMGEWTDWQDGDDMEAGALRREDPTGWEATRQSKEGSNAPNRSD